MTTTTKSSTGRSSQITGLRDGRKPRYAYRLFEAGRSPKLKLQRRRAGRPDTANGCLVALDHER